MRRLRLTTVAILMTLALTWGAPPLRAGICYLDDVPAATLLLP